MARPTDGFPQRFRGHAAAVRTRLALRTVFFGATAGLVASVPLATAAWAGFHGPWVPLPLGLGLLGAATGALAAWHARWSDHSVALFLDARLGTHEAIATAVGLSARAGLTDPTAPPALETVVRTADEALRRASSAVLPRTLRWAHLAGPVSVAAVLALAWLPRAMPSHVHGPVTPGVLQVQLDAVPGLSSVERLRELTPRSEAQRQRLERIADQARALREQLAAGMEQRRALDALQHLREALAAERQSLGAGVENRGLQAAAGQLSRAGMESAAGALAALDLAALDQAMEHLANAREAADRRRAHEALQAAADAAAQAGAPGVADALRQEDSLLRGREARNELLRRLAEQLGSDPEVRRAAEHLDRERSDGAARELAQTLERALQGLSPAERERLAQRMRDAARHARQGSQAGAMEPGAGGTPQTMSAEEMERALREMANSDPSADGPGDPSGIAAGMAAGGWTIPIPMMGPGGGMPGAGAPGESSPRAVQQGLDQAMGGADMARNQMGGGGQQGNGGNGGNGPSRGGGAGGHEGRTAAVNGDPLRARARAPMNRGAPMPGGVATLAPGRAGAVSRVMRTGDLRSAGPEEIHGVDRSDIPAEYRDQVRAYFQP